MNNAYKPLRGLVIIILAVAAVVVVSRAMRADERIPWRTDYAAAQAEARQSGKPLFVYFTASWCGPCQSLKHTTWADAGVERALSAYVPVKVDVDEQAELAARFQVQAMPTFLVMKTADGEPAQRTEGALPPSDFLQWLRGG